MTLKPSYLLDILERHFYQKLGKLRLAFSENERPSSYPFVSGDSFRALADHIQDETGTFDPTLVSEGDVVFVSQPKVTNFLDTLHKEIQEPYILIVHNGDQSFDEILANKLDERILHCFAQDVTCTHPKVTPIPIGLENKHFHINGLTHKYKQLEDRIATSKHIPKRKNRIFYSFSLNTNPTARGAALQVLDSHPLADKPPSFLSPLRHLKTLLEYKFVASPPGNAIESSRTWEALYARTIPIVQSFPAMLHFVNIGLPMLVIEKWSDLEKYSEADLCKLYGTLMDSANFSPLYMDYWQGQIERYQTEARNQT